MAEFGRRHRVISLVYDAFWRRLSIPSPTGLPGYFWQRVLEGFRWVASSRWLWSSGVPGHGSGSVSRFDFRGFPACAGGLVPEFGRTGWGFVITGWNRGPDGLPGRSDELEGYDIKGQFWPVCLMALLLCRLVTQFRQWPFTRKSFAGVSWFKACLFRFSPCAE